MTTKENNLETKEVKNENKTYNVERFDFAVMINDSIICKRNFKINNYVEHSMDTLEFHDFVTNNIINLINEDLKAKSRIYTWYYFNPNEETNPEFEEPLPEPWDTTFKFIIYDNGKEVYSQIWDGSRYPRYVRNMVDLSNKIVKFTNKSGRTFTYDKESYFEQNEGRLSFEMEVLKKMIYDRPNLLYTIAKTISDKCSSFNPNFKAYDKRQTLEKYGDTTYNFNLADAIRDEENKVGKKYAEKTRKYFANLY